MNVKHLVGAPGCGKTHSAMRYVELFLNSGFRPQDIAFVSFTKAAVKVARGRVSSQFGVAPSDLPYFGTIHSMAYRSVGVSRDAVLTQKKWGEFCRSVNLDYTPADGIREDDLLEPLGNREGDTLRRFHDWRRNCELSFDDAFRRFEAGPADNFTKSRAWWFGEQFEAAKRDAGLYDFTDMLLELAESGWSPPARVLIVDEAQDLSPLQRRIVLAWAEQIGNLLLAYDADQAIFGFQGADPEWLLNLCGQREFLTQSRRVPSLPARIAQRIIGRNRLRYNVTWEPKSDQGEVKFDVDLDACVRLCERDGGSWYFLARNRHYLPAFSHALMDAGVPFVNLRGHTPRAGAGVITALRIARGETVTLDALDALADDTSAREWWTRGAKADLKRKAKDTPQAVVNLVSLPTLGALPPLCCALSEPATCLDPLKSSAEKKEFHLRVYARMGMDGLTEKPEVVISTIHGVKGGEARNVVIDPQMTRRTYLSFNENPEPERRVWYVGASRTEHRLLVLDAGGEAAYDDW